ncbi:1-hydroxycarotenoid 3,4-desaturase CrtD [Jannaschia ovalis]|uniref:Phytoene desaturase family protein n=1 Tax=Jannaschia ovalis TaxID=3038773 RepID=A0ABY8LG48_9RHOB|nr:1-hydroxycarotenoid 3,4-desaturase CrtD [Jannaschia sp. GRR-S6-38]WGH80277.1 phytoene desaturase family protein [Jannaschia sp. GRR-S6-38]
MPEKVVIVGAGIGGLACAMRLAHAGCDVTVLESAKAPGGKMRTVPSPAGPVDAGPTVLTLRPVFAALFDACGTSLDTEVTLDPLPVLARHHWEDGASLDLFPDADRSADAIGTMAGATAARQFRRFHARTARLFDAFEAPMMQAADPGPHGMARVVARDPALLPAMAPGRTLDGLLRRSFDDPRLRQLFGRYATYVGGDPARVPALLALVWQAESRGVWAVRGGMHRLARAMQAVAERAGARFRFGSRADRIEVQGGRVTAVRCADGRHAADRVVFNGDPRALRTGLLGDAAAATVPEAAVSPRSLSAFVWSFAARPAGRAPEHHNVFFARRPNSEFAEIAAGRLPADPTLYVCAQDRGGAAPEGPERFEIIVNGPPRDATRPDPEEAETCRRTTFDRLAWMGLRFDPTPDVTALTTPEGFAALFPASRGALYGLSPRGMTAAFRRPRARTALPGLYLAGGGTHPGAGVPMAATSGRLAAEAILADRVSTSPSRRTAMPGGMSTASPRTGSAPSR